jgi:hypothetical protein
MRRYFCGFSQTLASYLRNLRVHLRQSAGNECRDEGAWELPIFCEMSVTAILSFTQNSPYHIRLITFRFGNHNYYRKETNEEDNSKKKAHSAHSKLIFNKLCALCA